MKEPQHRTGCSGAAARPRVVPVSSAELGSLVRAAARDVVADRCA